MAALIFLDKWLSRALEYLLILLFFGFFSMVCILVVLRYGFGGSIVGGNEGVTIAFVFTVSIGSALAITKREHIAITYYIDKLPLKLKKIVYIIDLLLIALINAVLIWYSVGWIKASGGAPWMPFRFPQGFFQMAIPIGGALAIFFCFVKIAFTITNRESVEVLWMPEDSQADS